MIVYDLSDFLIPENVSLYVILCVPTIVQRLKEYYKVCTLKLLSSSLTQWNVKYWRYATKLNRNHDDQLNSYNFNDSRGRIGKISSELKKQLLSILNTTKDKKIDTIGSFSVWISLWYLRNSISMKRITINSVMFWMML